MNPQQILGLHVLLSLVGWALLARWYVSPRLATRPREEALPPLLLPHAFRHMGLVFLLPTVVRGALPPAFARPAAYCDLAAGLLGGRDARPSQPLEHRGAADLALQRGGLADLANAF